MNKCRFIIRFAGLSLLGALPVFLLSGCWDRIEIEDRAVVLAISLDVVNRESVEFQDIKATVGEVRPPSDKLVQMTVQVAVPGRIPLGSSGGEAATSNKQSVWVLNAYGYTIEHAVTVLQQEIASPLFFGHLRMIVISEDYARRGTGNLNDFLRRNPEVRRLAWLAVAKGEAAPFMKTQPQLERVPSLYLLQTLNHAVEMGKYPDEFLGRFWNLMSAKGREANAPYLEVKKDGNIKIAGLAYFRGDRLVGVTNPLDIGKYMAIIGTRKGGYAVFIPLPDSDETVIFQTSNRNSKTKVQLKNGRPHFTVQVFIEGNIAEKSEEHATRLNSQRVIRELQRRLNESSSESLKEFISKLQQEGSDIFGFGELVRAKLPNYWNREIKTNEAWQEMFKTVGVDVNVIIEIRRTGMKAK